ncbi:MAG: GWxTD domain-containing protein [Acidobacteriota bacterium]
MRRSPVWIAVALLVGGSLSLPASSSANPRKTLREWARGPAHWLMLPEEKRALRAVRTDEEAAQFLIDFWQRRDPDPSDSINPAQEQFWERLEAADRLYGQGRKRGSMTPRGGALILFGAASVLRLSQHTAPSWSPRSPARSPTFDVTQVTVEEWEYPADELHPRLATLIRHEGYERAVLKFLIEADRTTFMEGERLLELAAQAAVER